MNPVITLTTDFAYDDAYVGAVKGAILSVNPEVNIVDICHSIEPQNVLQAAFILGVAYRYFPKQTIHLAIVDARRAGERPGIILKTSSAFFVAPDNGILSYVVDDLFSVERPSATQHTSDLQEIVFKAGVELVAITDPRFWRQPVSPTFHGRDILAPVAAGLSLGIAMYEFGEKTNSLRILSIPKPALDQKGCLVGQVLHIDHFGNLITNIRSNDLPGKDVVIEVGGYCIQGISNNYAQDNQIIAILGSDGYLEVVLSHGSACRFLGTAVGDEIRVAPAG